MLIDGKTKFNQTLMEFVKARYSTVPPADQISELAPAPARVNHGRWIVDCPECRVSAEYVWLESPVMLCAECRNQGTGWRRVIVPDNREAIEALLIVRPIPNRNWDFGDTLDKLRADNLAHGLEVTP